MDTTLCHHGDDFLGQVVRRFIAWLDALMTRHFKIKILPKVGPGEAREGLFLHRRIGWSEGGFEWEADPQYVQRLIELFELQTAKAADTPGVRRSAPAPDADDILVQPLATTFRSGAGTSLYLASDRPECQFATKEVLSGMQTPTVGHLLDLKRIARFYKGLPRLVWHFDYQDPEVTLQIRGVSDANWAAGIGDKRRSTSCGWIYLGQQLLETFAATQQIHAQSSAESEYLSITKTGAHCLEL